MILSQFNDALVGNRHGLAFAYTDHNLAIVVRLQILEVLDYTSEILKRALSHDSTRMAGHLKTLSYPQR
jgi:hypothetical protein